MVQVGNAFVQQYYHILQQSPELVYRFYQEGSKLGRPDAHGAMTSVTTTDVSTQNPNCFLHIFKKVGIFPPIDFMLDEKLLALN